MEENIPDLMLNLGLDSLEIALYLAIKTHSDESGLCNKSTKELAKVSRISKTEVPRIKKALAMPKNELNGKSLITIEKRVYEDGTILPDNIYIADLERDVLPIPMESYKHLDV